MISHLIRILRIYNCRDVVLVVTGYHYTSFTYRYHTCEPITILFADVFDPNFPHEKDPKYIVSYSCKIFMEMSSVSNGPLGRFIASEIIPMIKAIIYGKNNTRKSGKPH